MDGSADLDLAEALRRPIAGQDPSGRDTRYDPEHVALRTEVDKLDPVAGGGGTVDWGAVCEGSLTILCEKSKDLSVASYLCLGTAMTRGLGEFSAVVLGIAALIREQWATLHPRGRERRKLAPIEWALGRLGTHFEGGARGASAAEIEAASASLRELEAALAAVGVARVDALGDVLAVMARSSLTASPRAGTVDVAPSRDVARSGPPVEETRASEVSLASVMASMRTLARRMRVEDPSRAQAYRLARLGIWLDVEMPLPTRNGRTTALPVDPRTRTAIERAEAASRWLEVVDLAEGACLRSPLALDLQRLCHRALIALGPRFGEASQVVGEETLRLVSRDRGLLDALARDGSTLVDDATRGWITSLMPATTATTAAPLELDGDPEVGEPDALLERLEARLAASASAKSRAEMRLRAALRLGEQGRHGAAARVLAPLVLEIDRLGLVAWDPEFCAGVAEALIRSARQATVGEASRALELASSVLWMVKPLAGARFQPS